jgi:hypothetical protein
MTYELLCREARRRGWKVLLSPYEPKLSRKHPRVGHVLRVVDADGVLLEEHWVGEGMSLEQAAEWILRQVVLGAEEAARNE